MKKTLSVLIAAMLVLSLLPFVAADTPGVGTGIGINIDPVDFVPLIWMDPDSRIFYRNPADGSGEAVERVNNYAFEGEQIVWDVLVMDKNGIEKISDVYVTVGTVQGVGNDIEANCDIGSFSDLQDITNFNARIGEEILTELDADTMAIYTCTLTVETPNSMYGEYWVVAEVEDLDGNQNTFDENEFWFFNPIIALAIDGDIDFGQVLPGSMAYSDTLTVTNDADDGSGVLLDMQISGTDFYDPSSSGAKCPVTNRLKLNNGGSAPIYDNEGTTDPAETYDDVDNGGVDSRADQSVCDSDGGSNDDLGEEGIDGDDGVDNLCYFATNGAYSTANDVTRRDIEGYVGISYATSDDDNRDPIISSTVDTDRVTLGTKSYFAGNVLTPGADISVTFRLLLPEPCNGGFSDGQLFFWGEAI
ncbi:hypothetical protein J4409_02780 [Candidatus Woesearchaeota archaeon]|nr:hypothetical protein [Candidatus Woesearchaeota archaeon]